MRTKNKIVVLAAAFVAAASLISGCSKADETVNAAPPAGANARPDAPSAGKNLPGPKGAGPGKAAGPGNSQQAD